MSTCGRAGWVATLLQWGPAAIFVLLIGTFGRLSAHFLTLENLGSILVQSSWLIVLALGMNVVLLTAGVDLSVGAVMYLAAGVVGLGLGHAPVWVCIAVSMLTGALFGAMNATFLIGLGLPAFIVTLATTFVGRGLGLFMSSTRIVYASPEVAEFGRSALMGIPAPVWIAAVTTTLTWVTLNHTPFGPFVRSIGADSESAGRVGVPVGTVRWCVYTVCGALAGLSGFISLSQTSAASGAFGQNSEFLAIAAAVLGGTSLFGGRGNVWAPAIGAVLIMIVQNGLVMINANPYAYPVITGAVIFVAALFDSLRSRLQARLERRVIRPERDSLRPTAEGARWSAEETLGVATHFRTSTLQDLAGPVAIGPVWCTGYEVLRRIFVTVRDRTWQEVAPTHWECRIEEARRTVHLVARHQNAEVDFEWQGTLEVSDDLRVLRFAIGGRALRDMEVCRLGLVVLHPVESFLGAQLRATGPAGTERFTVADIVYPQPIVNGWPAGMTEPFTELILERADLSVLNLRFKGELFELEDQRNWGDASFKIHCTPLRFRFPRALRSGTVISQSVELRFTPGSTQVIVPASRGGIEVLPRKVPAIGREWQGDALPDVLPADEPDWDHIHVDLTRRNPVSVLEWLEASPSTKIQLGVQAGGCEKPPVELLAWLRAHREQISRLLLYGPGPSLPSSAGVERWRDALDASTGPAVALLAATRGYFVEFNRVVPLVAPVSGIAFPLSATVHADDAQTIMDNAPAIRGMTATARQLTQKFEVAVAPLALYHPQPATPRDFPKQSVLPWLTATLAYAGAAGVTSITLAEDVLRAVEAIAGKCTAESLNRLIDSARQGVGPIGQF